MTPRNCEIAKDEVARGLTHDNLAITVIATVRLKLLRESSELVHVSSI